MSGGAARAAFLRLEAEVIQLRELVIQLQERLDRLENQGAIGSGQSSIVNSPGAVIGAPLHSDSAAHRTAWAPDCSAASGPHFQGKREDPLPVGNLERVETLNQIGAWIQSALRGQHRGTSGRERLTEGSGCYLVFRAFTGQTFNPAVLCKSWAEAVPLVKPSGSLGDSVFVGLPSLTDARVVCQAAGVEFPED